MSAIMPGAAVILPGVLDEKSHRSEYRLAVCQTPEIALLSSIDDKTGRFFDVEARKKMKSPIFFVRNQKTGRDPQ